MAKTFLALLLFVLVACGGSSWQTWNVTDSEGLSWRLIECRHKADCMNHAARICEHNGYIDKYSDQNPRAMMVRCK